MIALLAGCALRRVEHYEPVSFALDPLDGDHLDALPLSLAHELERGRLRSLATAAGGVASLDALPPEAVYAVWGTLRPWARGAELDLLVDTGRGARPVTVWWSTRRDAVVAWGDGPVERPKPPRDGVEAWREDLALRYGLGEIGGAVAWTSDEVADVATALARLSPEELAGLDGIALRRMAVSPRSAARELAYFDPSHEPPILDFYDLAFEEGGYGFVGDVAAPAPAAAMTALHEFGHVLADAPFRRAYVAYLEAWEADPTVEQPYRDYQALGRASPVVAAWEAFRGRRKGPSSSGFRDPDESFAEAFALWHLDPDALERALPGARAWFGSGAHLRAAGLVEE